MMRMRSVIIAVSKGLTILWEIYFAQNVPLKQSVNPNRAIGVGMMFVSVVFDNQDNGEDK